MLVITAGSGKPTHHAHMLDQVDDAHARYDQPCYP
jgi:hypothetical protein